MNGVSVRPRGRLEGKRMSPFAGITQIKLNRIFSERQESNTGLHAGGFNLYTLILSQYHTTRLRSLGCVTFRVTLRESHCEAGWGSANTKGDTGDIGYL